MTIENRESTDVAMPVGNASTDTKTSIAPDATFRHQQGRLKPSTDAADVADQASQQQQ